MNTIIEDMRRCVASFDEQDAWDIVSRLVTAYDALEPTPEMWAAAPKNAMWYVIEVEGKAEWFVDEPKLMATYWDGHEGLADGTYVDLPLGVDWRLCKWQRPEVAQ